MKITSSKNNFQFSDNEYGYYALGSTQSTEISVNNPIKINTTLTGNVTFDPATYRWTLKKNRTYVLRASLLSLFGADNAYLDYVFFNITNNVALSKRTFTLPPNYTSRNSTQPMSVAIVTPSTDIVVDLRIRGVSNLLSINEVYSFVEIQQINIVSPVIPDPSLSVQAGVVQAYAGATIPAGYLNCDGSAISRTTYSKLFSALGTTWGAGDGSTTFNLPDLRSATLRGVGTPTLYTSNTVVALADTIDDKAQGHYHDWNRATGANGQPYASGPARAIVELGTITSICTTMKTDGTNGTPRTGLETTGKARGVYYIIKY